MNEEPNLYAKYCAIQKFDAVYCLEKYKKPVKNEDTINILDVGCGDGTVSLEVLLPTLPKNFKLTLNDISEVMINFVKKRTSDPKINFLHMDIASKLIPSELKEHFHEIFSFYCFHCLNEERTIQGLNNIFEMLKPSGNIFFTIIARTPLFEICEKICTTEERMPVWKRFQTLLPLYSTLEKPEEKLKSLLENAGFKVEICKKEDRQCVFPSLDDFMGFALSIIPYNEISSQTEKDKFIEDFKKEFIRTEITYEKNNKIEAVHSYSMLVAAATKP